MTHYILTLDDTDDTRDSLAASDACAQANAADTVLVPGDQPELLPGILRRIEAREGPGAEPPETAFAVPVAPSPPLRPSRRRMGTGGGIRPRRGHVW